jgi:glycosyltransferase involved in cell wall biosynthesis
VEETLEPIRTGAHRQRLIQKLEFVPDEETELYFKAADVLALPYTDVYQSGVIVLAYNFGLPVIATDVGSFREEVAEGGTGFICSPRDSASLQNAIEKYFQSDLFLNLSSRRQQIRDHAEACHSWDIVGKMTQNVYSEIVGSDPSRERRIGS